MNSSGGSSMYAQGVGSNSAIRRGDDVAGENKTERFLGIKADRITDRISRALSIPSLCGAPAFGIMPDGRVSS
jgi:hypothetical protein